MTWLQAIIISIIEGITEFLPISSTGHMIIASSILGIGEDEFVKLFEVCIQLGAILSVVVLYWKKFLNVSSVEFYLKLVVAVAPALVFGLLFSKKIDKLLESPMTVGITLLAGGIVLLFVDKMFNKPRIDHDEHLHYTKALTIGLWQVLALVPGVSRSAATIIGGMQQKLTRRLAAEFSFFLAVPTMAAATGYKLLEAYHKHPELLQNKDNVIMLLAGNVIAFVVAFIAVKSFITYLQKHSLRSFGIYRILAGAAVLILLQMNVIKKPMPKAEETEISTPDSLKGH